MNVQEQANKALKEVFGNEALIEVIDERGDGRHYLVTVASSIFKGKNRLEQSRLVYGALSDLMKKDHMHAVRLELKTL
ncbi:BolA family transcriptional regulator [Candidatus Peregrinibacteria bacterium CG10_big_fil_rev_8_21_14_0_10_36_19]|nr:MAG: BolA family transcriptional regulator [Candidatus Peregrinibacteria bacterium CG10_big_fil_rev_8_21_14_0_10_36_19]